jgi:hypothetical protein
MRGIVEVVCAAVCTAVSAATSCANAVAAEVKIVANIPVFTIVFFTFRLL